MRNPGKSHIHTGKEKTIPPNDRIQNRLNEQIRISPVRVIDQEGNQLGIIPTKEALDKARDAGMDLVEVAPDARPPVCRIMDFGKFQYEKSKKNSKSKSHQTKLKEIRLRPKTGDHDIDFKVKQAIGFLKHKDKVQITILFRGREMAHRDEGEKIMQTIIDRLTEEHGKLEAPPQHQPRRISATVGPK